MKTLIVFVVASTLLATPVHAKWLRLEERAAVTVAKSKLSVVPGGAWNRWSKQPAKQVELWSYDGPLLNRMEFWGGLVKGQPLAKERNKKREPLPKFDLTMKATDIADAYEQTIRTTQGASDFAIETIEPAEFAGRRGFRFAYRYTSGEVAQRGEARGAVLDGRLYMISYAAPALHYFDAHLAGARAIMNSAKVN